MGGDNWIRQANGHTLKWLMGILAVVVAAALVAGASYPFVTLRSEIMEVGTDVKELQGYRLQSERILAEIQRDVRYQVESLNDLKASVRRLEAKP